MAEGKRVESKYQIGQRVTVVPPEDPSKKAGYEHLVPFAGQTATITDIVGAHIVAVESIRGLPLFYLRFVDTNKRATAPEEWLAPA